MDVPHVNIHIENKVRDLLNHAGDGKISGELLRVLHVATAAGLQMAAVRRSIDRAMSRRTNLPDSANALRS